MFCSRETGESTDAMVTQSLPLVQRLLPPTQPSALNSTHRVKYGLLHLKQAARAVCQYNRPPLAHLGSRGLIECDRSVSKALSIAAVIDLRTELAEGFITAANLGAAAWSFPSRSGADLGPNG